MMEIGYTVYFEKAMCSPVDYFQIFISLKKDDPEHKFVTSVFLMVKFKGMCNICLLN